MERFFFPILANEATDYANIEWMSLVIRFADVSFNIRKSFLGFVSCTLGILEEAIATTIAIVLYEGDHPQSFVKAMDMMVQTI